VTAVRRLSTGALGVIVFVLLVVATVGAFFVTQRLKRSKPVVRDVSLPVYISPNGDGRKDRIRISFYLPRRDRVTVSMVDRGGDEVKRLADDRRLRRGRHSFVWRGRDSAGRVPEDGVYFLRVALRRQGRATTAPRGVRLVMAAPRPRLVSVRPARIRPGSERLVRIRFRGPSNPPPLFSVYRTGHGRAKLVDRFAGFLGSQSAQWDATDERGRPVPPGTYAFAVTVQNRARVAGSSPPKLPPEPADARPGTGVTLTRLQASGPLEPVQAGRVARIAPTGARGQIRWTLRRSGSARTLRRGTGRARQVRVDIPRRAATGLHVVQLRTRGGATARVPLAVAGRAREPVLVVLPAIAWQGLNPVDDDADGFPNTLLSDSSVAADRPFALGRLPAPLRREAVPLLRFLDDARLRYELTTDLALARGSRPRLEGHRGVLFAGSELWLTEELDRRLRAYVEGGGRVASFGTDAFRRTVQVNAARLADPSPRQEANVFGEQTEAVRSEAAPLVVHRDTGGIFSGSDGFIGLFTRFEQQRSLVSGTEPITAAGRDPDRPAFVAYRLGRGTVVRVGTPQWARAVEDDTEVAAATRAIWDLLSR
jgi:hypothetical protein